MLLFVIWSVCLLAHIGSASKYSTNLPSVSDPTISFANEIYSARSNTENDSVSTGSSASTSSQPETSRPTPTEESTSFASESGLAVTDLGIPFPVDRSSVSRFIPALTIACLKLLQEYARDSSDFVYCALAYAKPLLLCETCVDKFKLANRKFRDIEKTKVCSDSLLSSDRVQVLRETHQFLKRLWDKGSCDNCFKDLHSCTGDANIVCPVAKKVLTFQKYNKESLNCFVTAASLNIKVCSNCSGIYRKLSNFYSTMGNVEEVCIDCVELMNSTRKEWSIAYNCTYIRKDIVSIVAISIFFCSLPVFFYIGSKMHAVKTEHKLVKQSRLKKSQRPARPRMVRLPEHGAAFLTEDSSTNTI